MTLAEQLREEGRLQGKLEGKLEGELDKGLKIAQKLLKQGHDIQYIALITDISLERLEQEQALLAIARI